MQETFGKKLKRWREAAHVSQAELARRMNVSPTWVSNLERDFSPTAKGGTPQPSVETCDKIARALGVKVAEVRLAAGYAAPDGGIKSAPNNRTADTAGDNASKADIMRQALSLSREERIQVAKGLLAFDGILIGRDETITPLDEVAKEKPEAEDISTN